MSSSPLRVIARPAFENRDRNPYNALLYEALQARGVEVLEWGPATRREVREGDIVHVHCPESHLNHRRWLRAGPRSARLLVEVADARRRGARLVWTVHNLGAHDAVWHRSEAAFWRLWVPMVDGWLSLTTAGRRAAIEKWKRLAGTPCAITPIGHFLGVYPDTVEAASARRSLGLEPADRVLAFVGRVKPYKGVPELLRSFRQLEDPGARLVVAGRPETATLAEELRVMAEADRRVVLRLGALADEELQVPLRAADVVIAPFDSVLNSASALLALSFDRPIVVPAIGAMPTLRDVVGSDWVRTYEPPLTATILGSALETRRGGSPDLSAFDWAPIAERTEALYREVLAAGHGAARERRR